MIVMFMNIPIVSITSSIVVKSNKKVLREFMQVKVTYRQIGPYTMYKDLRQARARGYSKDGGDG